MVTGDCTCMLALLAAKALDAKNNADPINRLFDTVANFMTAPFFFPECTSGSGWGGPAHDHREKTLVFPRESPTMRPLGFGKQAARPVLLRVGVFSPGPPNRGWEDPLNPAKFPVLYRARAWWLATRLSLTTHCLR